MLTGVHEHRRDLRPPPHLPEQRRDLHEVRACAHDTEYLHWQGPRLEPDDPVVCSLEPPRSVARIDDEALDFLFGVALAGGVARIPLISPPIDSTPKPIVVMPAGS